MGAVPNHQPLRFLAPLETILVTLHICHSERSEESKDVVLSPSPLDSAFHSE